MKKSLIALILVLFATVPVSASVIPYWDIVSADAEFFLYNADSKLEFGLFEVDDFNNPDVSTLTLTTIFSSTATVPTVAQINDADFGVFGFYVYNVKNDNIFLSDKNITSIGGDLMGKNLFVDTGRLQFDMQPGNNVWDISFTRTDGTTVRWASQGTDIAPVPEPGTLLLLGSGLIGLAYLKRRKS